MNVPRLVGAGWAESAFYPHHTPAGAYERIAVNAGLLPPEDLVLPWTTFAIGGSRRGDNDTKCAEPMGAGRGRPGEAVDS